MKNSCSPAPWRCPLARPAPRSRSATTAATSAHRGLRRRTGSGTGGAVAGAVVGGLLGNQIGGGTGKTVATVAGVAGGAYAGKKIAENHTTRTRYKVTVRMDDGHIEHLDQGSAKNLHVGDYVKVSNGKASRL